MKFVLQSFEPFKEKKIQNQNNLKSILIRHLKKIIFHKNLSTAKTNNHEP